MEQFKIMDNNPPYDKDFIESCMQGIGRRILLRREQMRLTQQKLAELTGLSTQFFSCVETGQKNVRSENIIRLSLAMGVSTDYLLLGRSNCYDRNKISELLEQLNETQLKYAEEILYNFVLACKASALSSSDN